MHTLIALIVKATTKTEAEQKAWASIANYICIGSDVLGSTDCFDFGIVLDSKEDLARKYPDTYRWKCSDPANPIYKITEPIKTSRVDSELGQKFIRLRYPPAGYFVRDEEGNDISDQNDFRLTSSEYFVVPVDAHS